MIKTSAWLLLLAFAASCAPKVLTFTATPPRLSPGDSVHLVWQTRGVAKMSVHVKKIFAPPDSVDVWEYILTATRGSRVSAPSIRQVVVGAKRDILALTLTTLEGDSVVYTAQKDPAYIAYTVVTMTAQPGDVVSVTHAGLSCSLETKTQAKIKAPANCMEGVTYAGDWVLKRKLTPAEITDHHLIPGTYSVITSISPK